VAGQIVIRKSFKYGLYPTKAQIAALDEQLAEACRLYNAALQERRDAYHISHTSINYYDQANQLKEIRANGCGAPNPKPLSQRWHQCDDCGLSVARDHASALV
jgi:transposase